MSINVCIYRGRTASTRCPADQIALAQDIPQLPWAHKDSYCKGGKAPRYANCRNIPWKTQTSLTQIVPSNSRPVPLHRVWHAPGRPMPQISDNPECNVQGSLNCDIDLHNTPLNTVPSMNDEEYLSYSNPTFVRDADGIMRRSFYNGPGWVVSRVHGKSKSRALPRPIKHWRKQLFPRQKLNIYDQSLPMYPMNPPLATDPSLNNTYGGRQGRLSILDRPGGAITLDPSSVLQQYYAGNLNTTSCVPLYFPSSKPSTACESLRSTTACFNSIYHARPGHRVSFNRHSYSSSKMYLQARAKLYYQQATIQYNDISPLPVYGWQDARITPRLPPSSVSLYLNDLSGCYAGTPLDCSCVVPVTFKPRNATYAVDYAVNASTDIKRKRRASITRNQFNVTNKWGMRGGYDTLKHWPLQQYRRNRMPSGGTGIREIQCCDKPEFANHYPAPPEPSWDGCYTIDAETWTEPSTNYYTGFNIVPDKFLVGSITPELLQGRTVLAALYEETTPPTYTVIVQTDVEIWVPALSSQTLTITQGVDTVQEIATAYPLSPVGTPATIMAQTLTISAPTAAFTAIVNGVGVYTLCIIPA